MTVQTEVPLLDLKLQYDALRNEIEPQLREVCDSQYFVLGPKVVELENEICWHETRGWLRFRKRRAFACTDGT